MGAGGAGRDSDVGGSTILVCSRSLSMRLEIESDQNWFEPVRRREFGDRDGDCGVQVFKAWCCMFCIRVQAC